MPIVEDLDRTPLEHRLGEHKIGHIRPAPGSIDCEEAQAGCRQAVKVAVGMRHQLVGLLGGCIQADRMIDAVVLGERHCLVATVDARAAGVDQVLHVVMAATLEDVREANDVRLDVRVRVDQRIAHASLRCEVHHAVEPLLGKQPFYAAAVGDVELHEAETRQRREPHEPVALELRVVVVVEIVEANDLVASGQKRPRYMAADEARRTSDENFHVRSLETCQTSSELAHPASGLPHQLRQPSPLAWSALQGVNQ